MTPRISKLTRETGETQISVELNIDGLGKYQLDTGNGMFDHLLAQLSRHGLIDLTKHSGCHCDPGILGGLFRGIRGSRG